MNFTTPTLVELLILAIAGYRLYRLAASDSITERPRAWITGWREVPGGVEQVHRRPQWIDDLVSCPYCLGAWISLGLVALWWWVQTPAIAFSLPWAVSAAVALVTVHLDPS